MARSRTDAQHARIQIEKERRGEGARRQTERFAEVGREGIWQATTASKAAADGALRSGSAFADTAQEITAAWARYTEEVMRHTSEASEVLLRARTLTEMMEAQGKLLRNNMQAFLEQGARIAEATSRMATRPLWALGQASI